MSERQAINEHLRPLAEIAPEPVSALAAMLADAATERRTFYRRPNGRSLHHSAACQSEIVDVTLSGRDLVTRQRCSTCFGGYDATLFERLWIEARRVTAVCAALTQAKRSTDSPTKGVAEALAADRAAVAEVESPASARDMIRLRELVADATFTHLLDRRQCTGGYYGPERVLAALGVTGTEAWLADALPGGWCTVFLRGVAFDEPVTLESLDPLHAAVIEEGTPIDDGWIHLQCSPTRARMIVSQSVGSVGTIAVEITPEPGPKVDPWLVRHRHLRKAPPPPPSSSAGLISNKKRADQARLARR